MKRITNFLALIILCIVLLAVGLAYHEHKLVREISCVNGGYTPKLQLDFSVWFGCCYQPEPVRVHKAVSL